MAFWLRYDLTEAALPDVTLRKSSDHFATILLRFQPGNLPRSPSHNILTEADAVTEDMPPDTLPSPTDVVCDVDETVRGPDPRNGDASIFAGIVFGVAIEFGGMMLPLKGMFAEPWLLASNTPSDWSERKAITEAIDVMIAFMDLWTPKGAEVDAFVNAHIPAGSEDDNIPTSRSESGQYEVASSD
ncbi:hypothetical protein EXIGLDRAFT_784709 [Exidia glandulosa HHB12029]|uniref:Uncharacterized protein n=1 Tax=Exidia glandulosa HHB12029 TaxID=1314781 RepID=A0A166MB92_EXIGL|nr:hypothetical protein EXIGLDRAFT_784709 [Exidia glandulosa HHB12029]